MEAQRKINLPSQKLQKVGMDLEEIIQAIINPLFYLSVLPFILMTKARENLIRGKFPTYIKKLYNSTT